MLLLTVCRGMHVAKKRLLLKPPFLNSGEFTRNCMSYSLIADRSVLQKVNKKQKKIGEQRLPEKIEG